MTSNEIRPELRSSSNGITPHETDLADLIVQLGKDHPSHIVVPALHINRVQVREIFEQYLPLESYGTRRADGRARRSDGMRRGAISRAEIPVGENRRSAVPILRWPISGALVIVESGGQWPHVPHVAGMC